MAAEPMRHEDRSTDSPRSHDRRPPPTPRRRMLAKSREPHFKYDLREVLAGAKLEEHVILPFVQTVIAKGGRGSIQEARDYVTLKQTEGLFDGRTKEQILLLLDRYSKWQ